MRIQCAASLSIVLLLIYASNSDAYIHFELYGSSLTLSESFSSLSVSSKINCVAHCDRIPECGSISYNDAQNVCLLSEATKAALGSAAVAGVGFSVYTKVCSDGWWAFRNNCYKLIRATYSRFSDASSRCHAENSYLTDITDLKEHKFLTDLVRLDTWENTVYNSVWIGGGDVKIENDFLWFHDDSTISTEVLLWADGQPNDYNAIEYSGQDCINMIAASNSQFGLLHDTECNFNIFATGLICKV